MKKEMNMMYIKVTIILQAFKSFLVILIKENMIQRHKNHIKVYFKHIMMNYLKQLTKFNQK